MSKMMTLGATDRTELVFIPDPASTVGKGKTGLVAAALTVSYIRVETDNDVVVTDVTSSLSDLSALTDAHADWGVKEVSSTLAPGVYRLDIADAVFAAGAWRAVVYCCITSGLSAASPIEFLLGTYDPQERTHRIKKNVALANFHFVMIDVADHITPKTGVTVTAERLIDAGAFAACANSPAEESAGLYRISLDASDLNGDVITLKFTGTDCDPRFITIVTET